MAKKNILNYSFDELAQEIIAAGEKKFRAEQIFNSIHKRNALSFDEVTGIPSELRLFLSKGFFIPALKMVRMTESKNFNTEKFLFEISHAERKFYIEAVLISENGRETICVSTQAGCNVGCEFCATGKMGFQKNLDAGEIISQVYEIRRQTGIIPTNLVYMGMGEPFLNYENVIRSLKILCDERGLNLSSGKITVSTVGFKNKIMKFADDLTNSTNKKIRNVKLALSLHSTDSGIRESIIPSSKTNRLPEIYKELSYFYQKTKNKITYEYIFFEGLNDTENDLKRLEKISRMVPSNINVIPFHPIGFKLKKPLDKFNDRKDIYNLLSNKKLFDFIANLKKRKVVVNLRSSSGIDINAACGQLAVSSIFPSKENRSQRDSRGKYQLN